MLCSGLLSYRSASLTTHSACVARYMDETPELDEAVAGYVIYQVASAMDFLHSQRIVRRDV